MSPERIEAWRAAVQCFREEMIDKPRALDELVEAFIALVGDGEELEEPTQFIHIDGRPYALLSWDEFDPTGTESECENVWHDHELHFWSLSHALVEARDSLDAHCLEAFANNGERHTIALVLDGPTLYHGDGRITRISVEGANRYYIDIGGVGALRRELEREAR